MLSRTVVNNAARRLGGCGARAAAGATRGIMADIEVEHGRGEWKTYGDVENYQPGKFQIKTFNKISPIGLGRFPTDNYDVQADEAANAHAILLRSYKLQEEDIPKTTRAIAR